MKIIPKTRFGRWSVMLVALAILLVILARIIVGLQGPQLNQTFFSNPLLSITMLGAGLFIVAAFITGLVSIIKNKEMAILVFVSTFIGFLVILFLLGEIIGPAH